MADFGALLQQHVLWQSTLPLVRPFYPVKCNSSPAVIEILAALGVGFVCANKVTFSFCFALVYLHKQEWALFQVLSNFFFLLPLPPYRLKSQWYSTMMSLLRTSSCLVFANSSHTSNMLPRTASTTWCAIMRRSSERSPVLTRMPSQFPLNSTFGIFILKLFVLRLMFSILYDTSSLSEGCSCSYAQRVKQRKQAWCLAARWKVAGIF